MSRSDQILAQTLHRLLFLTLQQSSKKNRKISALIVIATKFGTQEVDSFSKLITWLLSASEHEKLWHSNFWSFRKKVVGDVGRIWGGFSGQEIPLATKFPQKECLFPRSYSFLCCSLWLLRNWFSKWLYWFCSFLSCPEKSYNVSILILIFFFWECLLEIIDILLETG